MGVEKETPLVITLRRVDADLIQLLTAAWQRGWVWLKLAWRRSTAADKWNRGSPKFLLLFEYRKCAANGFHLAGE